MLPFDRIGGAVAACLVPPLALLVAIWATAMLADRIGGPVAAIVAAVWLATSPVALIEAMQPMSDVPVTAAWLVCWAAIVTMPRQTAGRSAGGWTFGAGVAAGVAALIRPNLAPLAAVPALYVLFAPDSPGLPVADRVRRAAWFSVPVVVAGILIAYLQWRLFGSPLESGHGTAAALYSPSSFGTNAVAYTRWLLDTHGPWLLLAPLAVFVVRVRSMRWLLVFAALVVLAYLIYGTFEVWTYLRFLLPAIAIAMVAATAIATRLIAALPASIRGAAAVVLALLLAAGNINAAQAHGVFQLGRRDGRALVVGHYLEAAAPARAVFVAGEESGALRYYTGRSIIRWDVLSAEALDSAVERLRGRGYEISDCPRRLGRGALSAEVLGEPDRHARLAAAARRGHARPDARVAAPRSRRVRRHRDRAHRSAAITLLEGLRRCLVGCSGSTPSPSSPWQPWWPLPAPAGARDRRADPGPPRLTHGYPDRTVRKSADGCPRAR